MLLSVQQMQFFIRDYKIYKIVNWNEDSCINSLEKIAIKRN